MRCKLCGAAKISESFAIANRQFFECFECDLLFCHSSTKLTFEEERSRYLQHDNSGENSGYLQHLSKLVDAIVPLIPPMATGLDYGCGHTPVLSELLIKRGFVMDNFDPFFGFRVTLESNAYDFVTCSEALEHFSEPIKELTQIVSLLKPEATVAFMTGLREGTRRSPNWWYLRDITHRCFYSVKTFNWLATHFNLTLIQAQDNIILLRK